MRFVRWVIFSLIVASLGGGVGASKDGGSDDPGDVSHFSKKRARGDQQGNYGLTVAGRYTGKGTASVGTTVSLQANISETGGATGTLAADNLPVSRGYFKGNGTVMGTACTIHGRVDLASAQDGEETDRQATTARITGTFQTVDGKMGRLLAVQGLGGK